MRKTTAVLVAAAALAVTAAPSSASALGFAPANAGVEARLLDQFPTARQVFINCPGNNRVAAGLMCETRFIFRGKVRIGHATAEPDSERWEVARWSSPGILVDPPVRRAWGRCRTAGILRRDLAGSDPHLHAFAVPCTTARQVAATVTNYIVDHEYERLPRRFSYDRPMRQGLGFILSRFGCSSRVQIRQGNPNPYGHVVVRCSNGFRDRLIYTFDQGS